MTKHVLILDDDASVRAAALQCLALESWSGAASACAGDPEALAREHAPDVLVLGAVDAAGLDASSAFRRVFGKPVVPLFRPSVYTRQRLSGVDLGPGLILGLLDCRVRIGQCLEARATPPDVAVRWGDFTLKLEPGAFAFRGTGLGLTKVQGAIFSLLMLYSGEIVSSRMIEEVVFRNKPKSRTNFISVHISRLRVKLKENKSGVFIENVKGDGYVLFWNTSFSSDPIPAPKIFVTGAGEGLHNPERALRGLAPQGTRGARHGARMSRC